MNGRDGLVKLVGALRSGHARAGDRSRDRPRWDKALETDLSRVVNAQTAADNCPISVRNWLTSSRGA